MSINRRSVPRHRRLGAVIAGMACASVLIAPSPAGSAVQIGETFTPTSDFGPDHTAVQSGSPGGAYAAPFAGVITSWSFEASATAVPQGLKFKVARHVSGDVFEIVGESPPKDPVPSALNTYTDVRIPVRAGDVIGLYMGSVLANTYRDISVGAGYIEHEINGDVAPGTSTTFDPYNQLQLDVSAMLEGDCDSDGFGDETQDSVLTGPNCPKADGTLMLDANKGKVEKGRKVTLLGQIDTPTNQGCESGRTVELQRHKKNEPDSEFHTFATVQTDAAGNFELRKKVELTKLYRAVVTETDSCNNETSNSQKVRVQKKKAVREA